MTDINDLMQDFWKISSGGAVDVFFPAMRCLMWVLNVYQDRVADSRMPWSIAMENPDRLHAIPGTGSVLELDPDWILSETESDRESLEATENEFLGLYQKIQKMLDRSLTKSSDISDLLRFLPGIVVQKGLTMQGMANLYRVKMDILDRLSKSTFEPFTKLGQSSYVLQDYLSDFLRDRDRSHHRYCDPMRHHVLICRQFLSLLDGSDVSDLQL